MDCRKLLAREESSNPSLDSGREVLALTTHKCSARADNGNLAGDTTEMEKKARCCSDNGNLAGESTETHVKRRAGPRLGVKLPDATQE